MATVLFWEKPGCVQNARQRTMLKASGHQVDARNLLAEPWTEEQLSAFFQGLPIQACINRNAPAIKSGELRLEGKTAREILTLMTEQPLLKIGRASCRERVYLRV